MLMPPGYDQADLRKRTALADVHYEYPYPYGLDLKPGSELHDKLRDAVCRRLAESHSKMQDRHVVQGGY